MKHTYEGKALKIRAIKIGYWKPGHDYLTEVATAIKPFINDYDIVVVSEKALATAKGQIFNESNLVPSITSIFLARFWMRFVWGYLLGPLCRLRPKAIQRLRAYPLKEGSLHKELVLRTAGFLHALKYGSEGGIDLSNLPYNYACLPLENPMEEAKRLQETISCIAKKTVTVIIADTDSTFSIGSYLFTSRPNPMKGINSFPGPLSFIVGRALRLRQRATPLAIYGLSISIQSALEISEKAHHKRGYGAGRTIWDMMERYNVKQSAVTWKMLSEVKHYPIVLIRCSTRLESLSIKPTDPKNPVPCTINWIAIL